MFWPDTGTGVDVEPARKPVAAAVRKFFTEGGVGVPPTVPGGDWFNQITNELMNLLAAANIDPSKVEDDQILEAIKRVSNSTSAREALRRSYAEVGYTLVDGSFEAGGTLTSITDVLLYESNGHAYSWGGSFPVGGLTVPPESSPTGMWTDQSDVILRTQLQYVIYKTNGAADAAGLQAAATAASAAKKVLMINGIARCESLVTITCKIFDTCDQLFTTDSNVRIGNGKPVRPEWFGNGEQSIALAIAALPVFGGGVELHNATYASPYRGPFGASYVSKDNVTIRGAKCPEFEDDHTSIIAGSGTIIQGSFYAWANNFEIENLGVDSGPDVRAAIGLEATQDGLILAPPTHTTSEVKNGGRIKNCISLGVLANDFGHNILHEGYTSGEVTNVDGRCAIHNIAIKSSNVIARTLRARGAINDNLVVKSDDYGVNEDSHLSDVILSEYPGNVPLIGAYINAATAGLTGAITGEFTIRSKAAIGFCGDSASASALNYGMVGSKMTIDGSPTALKLIGGSGGNVSHAKFSQLVIKNATVGIEESGNCSSNSFSDVTFVAVKTQFKTVSDPMIDNVTVLSPPASASLIEYGASANPTIGLIKQSGLSAWDNIAAPTLLNGWTVAAAAGNPAFDVFARDGDICMSGILNVGATATLAFNLDSRFTPTTNQWVPLQAFPTGGVAYAVIQNDGGVYIEHTAGVTRVSLAGVKFKKAG